MWIKLKRAETSVLNLAPGLAAHASALLYGSLLAGYSLSQPRLRNVMKIVIAWVLSNYSATMHPAEPWVLYVV